MSTQISEQAFRNFFIREVGGDKIYKNRANEFDISEKEFEEANVDPNDYIDIDEAFNDPKLYEKFATMYEQKQEELDETKDEDKEKQELYKVKDKNGADNK